MSDEVFETYIDIEDLDRVKTVGYKWGVAWDKYIQGFYARATIYKGMDKNNNSISKSLLLHRYIMNAKKGDIVDHINHNPLDNRKINLRVTNVANNSKHRVGKNKNNTSGYRNVSWSKWRNKWVVQLQVNGKNTVLGEFDDVHDAGEFAKKMRKEHYGEYKGIG